MPSLPPSAAAVDRKLKHLDGALRKSGLVRTRRQAGPSARAARERRFKSLIREELPHLNRRAPEPAVAANGVQWLPVPGWEGIDWLWCGFSTRKGGVSRVYCAEGAAGELNLGFTPADSAEAVVENRGLLAEAITGSAATPLATIRQIHSNIVIVAGRHTAHLKPPPKADGLMTGKEGLLLGVQTADCIPVLVVDRQSRAVAAFHAGWRGTVSRIVENGIGRMRLEFGSRPEDLVAAIGPGIGPCCYEVGDEVFSAFESQFDYARELFFDIEDADELRTRYPMLFLNQRPPGHGPAAGRLHLDLAEANRRQLLAAGLEPESIQVLGGCTACREDLFFSHRASGGRAGRMMSVIGIRPRN
jgi:polyphenol oxidase